MQRHEPITIDVFCAAERPDLTAICLFGQAESYGHYLGGPSAAACGRPRSLAGVCVALARDDEGRPHAGMRVHLRTPGEPLPVERALGERCAIAAAIAARGEAPLVELCGLWISADYRKLDLAAGVTRAALACARALGARAIVGCAHQHVLEFYRRYGAEVDRELGEHAYPDARYRTCVVWADPVALAGADPAERAGVDACAEQLARGEALRWSPARFAA